MLAWTVALLLLIPPGGSRADPPGQAAPDGGADAGVADAGARDPDDQVIEQLDALQSMELLENLELFDPQGGDAAQEPR